MKKSSKKSKKEIENRLRIISTKQVGSVVFVAFVDKVDLGGIYDSVYKILEEYIDTTKSNLQTLTLWIMGTYLHDDFTAFPHLHLYAQKRSGKSRTLKLISSLGAGSDGSVQINAKETLLYRHTSGTLCFDEMESINSKEMGLFREILNASYKKGSKVTRFTEQYNKKTKKREYLPDSFSPYYPIALANINGIGDVLEDRSIQIILQRSNKAVTKLMEDFGTNIEIRVAKGKMHNSKIKLPYDFLEQWNKYIKRKPFDEKLRNFFEKVEQTEIYGRYLELYFPLFVIAYLSGKFEEFLETAKNCVASKEEDSLADDVDELLKNFLLINYTNNQEYLVVGELTQKFRQSLGHNESDERWINAKWFGKALKRLGVVSKKRHVAGRPQIKITLQTLQTLHKTTNTTNTTNITKIDNIDKKENNSAFSSDDEDLEVI